jgi:NitT/TauT family transport system permease protein
MARTGELEQRPSIGAESPAATAADRGRPGGRRKGAPPGRRAVVALQVSVGLSVLAIWEASARLELINPRLFSQPAAVIGRVWSMVAGESLYGRTVYEHLLATGTALAIGFSIGAVAGLALGFFLGRSRFLSRIFEPYLLAIYSIPKIAIAPLFVLLFGIDLESKIAVVVMGVFFMVFFSTYAGVMSVNEEFVNIARIMGASRRDVTRRVILPAAMPSILIGLKMGVPFGVIGAIIGEYIAATQGIGWLIIRSAALFDSSGFFAALVFLVASTWVLSQLVTHVESRVLRWQPRRRQELVTY